MDQNVALAEEWPRAEDKVLMLRTRSSCPTLSSPHKILLHFFLLLHDRYAFRPFCMLSFSDLFYFYISLLIGEKRREVKGKM